MLENKMTIFNSSCFKRILIGVWFLLESIAMMLSLVLYGIDSDVPFWSTSIDYIFTSIMLISCFCMGCAICFLRYDKVIIWNRIICYGISTFTSMVSIPMVYMLLALMFHNVSPITVIGLHIFIIFNFPVTIFTIRKYSISHITNERSHAIWFIGQALSSIFIILNLNFTEIYDYWLIIPFSMIIITGIHIIYTLPHINRLDNDIIMIYASVTFLVGIMACFINAWIIFIVSAQNIYAALYLYYYIPNINICK